MQRNRHTDDFTITYGISRLASPEVPPAFPVKKDCCMILNVKNRAGTLDHF